MTQRPHLDIQRSVHLGEVRAEVVLGGQALGHGFEGHCLRHLDLRNQQNVVKNVAKSLAKSVGT